MLSTEVNGATEPGLARASVQQARIFTKLTSGRTEIGATLSLLNSANLQRRLAPRCYGIVCVAGSLRDREIRPIQDVENLCPPLDVEVFRDSLDGVILEQREIEVRQSWPS